MLYTILSLIFVIGYLGIVFEQFLKVNKAATAVLMAVFLWLAYYGIVANLDAGVMEELANTAQIIFFLLAAMAIVELMDSHGGFRMITDILYSSSRRKMLWFLVLVSFFMSSILDNLTSMIVMISLLKKLIPEREDRWLFGSLIVISVNAGGAWTPIGDVTTTLLWIHDKFSTWNVIKTLFLPSFVNVVVSTLVAYTLVKGEQPAKPTHLGHKPMEPGAKWVFYLGILVLILIPVWKGLFNFPPFMGALLGLGVLWLVTDLLHFPHGHSRTHLRLPYIFTKIDTAGIIFFLGILLAINALTHAGILKSVAVFLEEHLPNQNYVAVLIGLISSVVDNIPLVAATIGMYDFPKDHSIWLLIAYAAGTGGSILIVGSAAGVAFMGLDKVDFLWYFKKISWIALIGYIAGLIVYFVQ